MQFAREGIRVNALCPGPVNTPLLQELFAKDPERAARRLVHIPVGRFAEPEEIAAAVLFLASDDSSFITASTVPGRRRHLRRLRHAAVKPPVIGSPLRRAGVVGRLARRPGRPGLRGLRRQVREAGGQPVLVPPPDRHAGGRAGEVLAALDGLIIAGGADVDPAATAREPHPCVQPPRPDRDAPRLALVAAGGRRRPAAARVSAAACR